MFLTLTVGVGSMLGATTTYTFTNSNWNAKIGSTSANWTCGKEGAGFSNNGVQVTTNATGAYATSPKSFENISQIIVTYNTNKNSGAGTLKIKVGDNTEKSNTCKYSGSSDGRSANFTSTFNFSPTQSGSVKLTVNTTTNSIYVVSVKIITEDVVKTPTSITLSEAGATQSITGKYVGDSYTLPSTTTAACGTKTFVGWSTDPIDNSAGKPASDFYERGASVTLGANNTFYAVFAESGGTGSTSWEKTDISGISTSDVVVITMSKSGVTYAMMNNGGTSNPPGAEKITINGNTIESTVHDTYKWNISNNSGNLTIYPNGKTSTWLYCTNDNNGVRVGTNTNKTFTISGNYLKHTGTSRYVGVYTTNPDWRCYTSTSTNIDNQTLAFYKKTTTGGYQNYTTECVTAQTYTVTIANDIQNGSVIANPTTASEGDEITLTPTPANGFKFSDWNVTREDNSQAVTVTNNTFTMPASNVTVSATFVAIPQLDTPTNLSATDITTTAATLTWEWSDNENSQYLNGYNLYYKKVGDANFTGPLTCNTNSSNRTGLTPNTEYVFKVAATSNNINECKSSEQSAEFNFKTKDLTQLATPTNLPVTNITCTEATLSWDAVTNKKNYKLTYTDGVSTKEVTTGSESVTLNNLLSGTTYTWEIQAIGDGTNYTNSEVADGGSFTTNYKITYDVKGGSWTACADGCVASGEDFTICSTVPTKTGYNFMGWSTADDQIAEYQAEETIENVSANITLYAVWEQKKYTVNWYVNGTSKREQTDVEGAALTDIPEPTTSDCDNSKVFVGWTTKADYSHATDAPDVMITNTTGMKMPEGGEEYYAVFATEEGDGGSAGETTTVAVGDQVVIIQIDDEKTELTGFNKTITDNNNYGTYAAYSTTPSATLVWTVEEGANDGTFAFKNGNYYLNLGDNDNHLSCSTTKNTSSSWTVTESNNRAVVTNVQYDSRKIMWNQSSPRFACYNKNHGQNSSQYYYHIKFYKLNGGTSYSDYTTTCVEVQKYEVTYTKGDGATGTAPTETPKAEGTIFTLASADGISKEGYSFAGWLCNNDDKIYGASEEYTMPKADVTFTAQWNELPKHTVTFYNKGKEYSQVTQTIANAPIECPTGLVACDGYTFAGWSTEELDGVSTFSKIEGEYTPTENITLYAVYAEGNVTTNGWVKVTDLSTITEGTYALLSNNDYAFNGTISKGDGQSTSTAFVFDGEGVATLVPNGICEIQLIATGSGFTMYNESKGYLYAKAASSGNLEWHATENSSWSWSSTKENWVYADNNAYLRSYNNTFRTYGNSSNNAIYFAKKNVTSFTTSPACDPMITIGSEVPVMVTSAKDIRVDAVQNITISATNLDQNADKAQVSIKIVSDNSVFKFKEVDANGDGQATLTWTGIANATFDKTLCVTYTPTEAGQEETATLTVTAYRHNGSAEYATATMQVRGRSLPEQFVLVANTGDGWVALPNTLGIGSTASIPYPIAVEVDNDADPTSIPLAPSTTIYKAAARSTVNAIPTGLRFTTETGGYMQASTTETNIWLASNNSENMQSWTLNSTDFVDYSIRVNNAAEGHYLNYSNTQKKIGNYKSDNKLRILPVEDICEQHAAPGNLKSVTVLSTSATIQWDAVATATSGYEYRIGTIGEWTEVGNITELELTGLTSLTNYIVYVRASVEGTTINCSYESEVEFTTLNCDDVPYDIHYASGANSVTVYWTCEAATSTISLYHDKEGLSLVETKTSVTSPCQFTGLDKFTTYYVQIQAGGSCPSGMIQVRTEQLDLDVVEWMSDGVVVDVNTDETITVTLENEVQYGSGVGQKADDLFFSKYFEGSGNLKLLAIYNGTGKDVDLSIYRIDRGSDGNATKIGKKYNLSQLGTIKNGQEIIFYSKPSSGEYPYTCSQSFLASKDGESGVDANPRWILCDAKEHNGVNFETMDFNGDDPLLLYKGNTLIDVFGVSTAAEQPSKKTQCSKRTENSWSADDVANMDYGKTEADFEDGNVPEGVDLLNPTITAYTARVIMFRKNTVLSGSNAVAENITDFVTLASEWEARSVCKSGNDGDLTCGAYQELGKFDYADYYTKYETIAGEQVFDENARLEDGTIKIGIPNLSTYSCKNIKFNIKIGGVIVNEVTKVPILIADEQSTKGGDVFANLKTTLGTKIVNGSEVTIEPLTDEQLLKKCETCDIVVLANGKLTHETDGINQFNDLTIYPEGVFHNTSEFNVNRLLIHAKKDDVGYAIIENEDVSITTDAIAHTKRIDAQYWYPFSLPYNCNIADITQANGEPLGDYGVHWGIQYYDGKKRQESGTSAGIGQSSNFWTPIYNSNEQLKAYQGYMIALFDASVSSPTEMRTIYFPPVSAQMYTESGTDSKETTITSWNVNLSAEKRHHGWNFTGSPYISVFNPQATGLSEDFGLFSEVLIVSGHYDQGSNEYLYDDEYVYVSIPSPNGAKYYDQYITSATSLKPFTAYFVQAIDPTSGNDETQTLAYAKAGRELPSSAPRRSSSTRQRVLVELGVTAPDGQTDNTGIWVDEKYTSAYEIAADLTKMYVAGDRPQLYTMAADNEKMAYNALPDEMAGNVQLGLYAPTAGSYTLFINERVSRLKGVERVDLLYNNVVVADLLSSAYVIDVPKKGAVNGYTISVCRKANVTTAIDNISGQPINIITGDGYLTLEGIVSDAQVSVYDMLGRLVAAQNANDETKIRIPFIVQGVYNVVVKNEQGMTTIKVVLR